MAVFQFMLHSATIFLVLSSLICFLPNIQSQSIGNEPPSVPNVRDCSPVLLPLAPCGPFVEGTEPSPAQSCCDKLRQLDSQQLNCLCLVANDPSLSSYPINRTLAFELPTLCSIQGGISNCSGTPEPEPLPPSPPTSQVSFGTITNTTVAASPMVTVEPRLGIKGDDPNNRNNGAKLNVANHLVVALLAEIIFVVTTYAYESWSIMFLTV